MIVTFDADSLTDLHFGDYPDFRSGIVGLSHGMHLRDVIENGRETLDPKWAGAELVQHICAAQRPQHRHILLECTNLPPYKAELFKETGLPITDVLTEIEEQRRGTITPAFLVGHAG